MARTFKTIQEMEEYFYGPLAQELAKADDPILSTTTGIYYPIYGRKVWSQLNLEANAWAVLPKKPWDKSGERVLTDVETTSVDGGIAETGTLPDTDKPSWNVFSTKPKTVVHGWEISEVAEFLSKTDDGLGDVVAYMREYKGKYHAWQLNKMLWTQNGSPAGNNFESIDRICGSNDELSNCKESDGSTSYSANDLDIYGIDRDAGASWADAIVLHNSSTLRDLTLDLIDEAFQKVREAGGEPKVILTGWDTLRRIQGLLSAKQRYVQLQTVQLTVNGIKTVDGVKAGFQVASYNGVPIIPCKGCVQDSGGLSRIYLLDTDYIFIKVAKPTQYFESADPIVLGKFAVEGYYRTMGEVICTRFNVQAKIRDIR